MRYINGINSLKRYCIRRRRSMSTAEFDGEIAELYNRIAENHRHAQGPWSLILNQIQRKCKKDGSLIIVDVASGPGEPSATISQALPSATVFSTDISVDMHKIASKKAVNIPNMKAMVADAADLNAFESESVDVVTCCYGLMFPDDKLKCLQEIRRVLKPRGLFINTHWSNLEAMHVVKKILKSIYSKQPNLPKQHNPINPLSLAEPSIYQELCLSAGTYTTIITFTYIIIIKKGFKKENIESVESTYPFNMGNDKDYQFKLVTLPIRNKIEEFNAMDLARKIYDENIDNHSVLDQNTGNLMVVNNVFVMTTIIK